jgi:hypothetical protein
MKYYTIYITACCILCACQEPLEQSETTGQSETRQQEMSLGAADGFADVASDGEGRVDVEGSADEAESLASRITYNIDGPPEGNVPIQQTQETSSGCLNDRPQAESVTDGVAARAPIAESVYRPVVSIAPEYAPIKPSDLGGDRVLALAPQQEMVTLYVDFQAQGCDQPARAEARACVRHPYNEAIRREIEDPTAALQAARAEYAAARSRRQGEGLSDAP